MTRSIPPRELQHFINAPEGSRAAADAPSRPGTTAPRKRVELYEAYDSPVPARRRGRFRRTAAALLRAAGAQRAAAPPLPGALPPHPGRRVPGHQQPAVPVAEAAGRRRRCGHVLPSATTTSRSTPSAAPTSATCATSSASSRSRTSSAWSRTTARTATSSTPPTPSSRTTPTRLGKNLWTEAGAGEPIRVFEAVFRRRRGALDRRGGQGPGARRPRARRDRAALSLQRAVAGAGTCAVLRRACPIASMAACASSSAQEIKHALAYLRLIANPTTTPPSPAW